MPNSPQQKHRKSMQAYAKYGGMAFMFLGACLLGVFIGKWLDARMGYESPVWAVFLTVGCMVAALVSVVRQLLNEK